MGLSWLDGAVGRIVTQKGRAGKRALMVAADLVMLPLALWSAFAIRLSEWFPPMMMDAWWMFLLVPIAGVLIFARLGLYRAVVRFMGRQVVMAVVSGVAILALFMWGAAYLIRLESFPRTVPVIFAALAVIYVGGSRYLVRLWYQEWVLTRGRREEVLIFGAGQAGVQLASALSSAGCFRVVAFIDEDVALKGSVISGVPVRLPSDIPEIIQCHDINRLLLAIPTASRNDRSRILEMLEDYPFHVQTIPSMDEMVAGDARFDQIRDLDASDLLGRDPISPNDDLLAKCITGKVVMVTGAGGAIGSELCRQIIQQGPLAIVAYDVSEYALYKIEQDLSRLASECDPGVQIFTVLGSVTNRRRMRSVIDLFGVNSIYHAAAYKHVPMVEHNVIEGVVNNVFGTRVVAQEALAAGVERVVLISTDKAVRPTNVMGATKRLAEMVLQSLAERTSDQGHGTIFAIVRFGNVLGSSGSVVPLFHDQISRGGPLTVTHPDITRYFMTIPEAAELVIQAGAMAEGGEVFVLDMGEPVRIVDLAKRMIHLHGFKVAETVGGGDHAIEIRYTGLRPGEKLYEELLIGDNVSGTEHPRIMRASEGCLDSELLEAILRDLEVSVDDLDVARTHALLRQAVVEFKPSSAICDWLVAHRSSANQMSPKVVLMEGFAVQSVTRQ